MESRRFYTSPVNHHNLEKWDELASRLERAVSENGLDVSVELGREPVFRYGTDGYDVLDAVSAIELGPRQVRIDLWSSIVMYETLCLTSGPGIRPEETKAITTCFESALGDPVFLRAVEGPYDIDSAQVFGYSFDGSDEAADESAIERLLDPFDTPLYIGPRSCILDENEQVDNEAFELFTEQRDVAVFVTRSGEAARRLWKSRLASSSDGLIALFAGDPADAALIERFSAFDDLRILLNEQPSAGMRVTLGRCHVDDDLVVVYTPPDEPAIDQTLLFVI